MQIMKPGGNLIITMSTRDTFYAPTHLLMRTSWSVVDWMHFWLLVMYIVEILLMPLIFQFSIKWKVSDCSIHTRFYLLFPILTMYLCYQMILLVALFIIIKPCFGSLSSFSFYLNQPLWGGGASVCQFSWHLCSTLCITFILH